MTDPEIRPPRVRTTRPKPVPEGTPVEHSPAADLRKRAQEGANKETTMGSILGVLKRPLRHLLGAVLGGIAGAASHPAAEALGGADQETIAGTIALSVALAVYALVEKQMKRVTGEGD